MQPYVLIYRASPRRRSIGISVRMGKGEYDGVAVAVVAYPLFRAHARAGEMRRQAERFAHAKQQWVEKTARALLEKHERTKHASVHTCSRVCTEEALPLFLKHYEQMCDRFGLEESERPLLFVKPLRSRWGHYKVTKKGLFRTSHSITLATRLLHVPRECLDMVIAHELCHIRYQSHGPRFKAYLTQMYPRWREVQKILKQSCDFECITS